jgi:hypothetical protein
VGTLQQLDWDDEEAATKESLRRFSLVDLELAPHTERDAAPVTQGSPGHPGRDSSPTASFRRRGGEIAVEIAADSDSEIDAPESAIRSTGNFPRSQPIPLVELEIDERETQKRHSVVDASGAVLLVADALEQVGALRAEVARLRRWLWLTAAVALLALVAAGAVALVHLPADVAPAPIQRADLARASQVFRAPAITVMLPKANVAQNVEVVVTLLTPHASVALTPFGGLPDAVSGPWPRILSLAPGRYTLTAAKMGRAPVMRMLDLSLDQPRREVSLALR